MCCPYFAHGVVVLQGTRVSQGLGYCTASLLRLGVFFRIGVLLQRLRPQLPIEIWLLIFEHLRLRDFVGGYAMQADLQ